MTRTADEAVWSLKGVSGLVGDVILRCEETGILQLYKPFSNYLNESALEAGHKLLLSHFNVQRRHKDDNKDAKDIKVNAPVPVLTIGSRLHGGARATLSTGIVMPALAFGTWKLETTACELAVTRAIESGMRHIDSAQAYGNERWTGAGIRNALDSVPGLTRTDLFIATKLSMESESGGYEETNALIAQQMKDLRVTYLDMYYLHSPFRDQKLLVGSLTAIFEHILEGKIRALGLSNFDAVALDDLYSGAFGTAVQAATRTKDGSNKQRSGLNTEYLARLRPVVLQNKVDLYHTGRQFDNEGNDVRALALKYRLFLMGYSPFSGYPFALMPTWDPVLTMVASSYFATLSEADKAAEAKGGDGMSWAQVCVSDVDIDCSADDGKVQRAALLLQYQFKHLGAGAILRSVSRTSITTALFATSADMIPLSEEAMGALHTVQELIVTPLLKSTEFTFDGTL
jgi:diketogulonate reductase-like aldo/keto reductase